MPSMNWYYVDNGKQSGPISDEQLDQMLRGGKIKPDSLVWREGMADWAPYREARGGTAPTGTTAMGAELKPEAICAECGKVFPKDETIRYGEARVCAACKPVFLQKLQEGALMGGGAMRYAGFWIRFAARFLDGLIIVVPMIIVLAIVMVSVFHNIAGRQPTATAAMFPFFQLFFQAGFLLIKMAYEIFFIGKYGATPGKMACGLRVVTSDGGTVSYARAAGRFFAMMLSGLTCYIGFIIAAFDGQKRALHDHICNTRVVYK